MCEPLLALEEVAALWVATPELREKPEVQAKVHELVAQVAADYGQAHFFADRAASRRLTDDNAVNLLFKENDAALKRLNRANFIARALTSEKIFPVFCEMHKLRLKEIELQKMKDEMKSFTDAMVVQKLDVETKLKELGEPWWLPS